VVGGGPVEVGWWVHTDVVLAVDYLAIKRRRSCSAIVAAKSEQVRRFSEQSRQRHRSLPKRILNRTKIHQMMYNIAPKKQKHLFL